MLKIVITVLLFLMTTIASAGGFGEVAGSFVFHVNAGSSESLTWILINSYNQSLNYTVYSNSSYLSFNPHNGTINSSTTLPILVTANIPANATNQTVDVLMTASAQPFNDSIIMISSATDKLAQIDILPPITTTTTINETSTSQPTSQSPGLYLLIVAIIAYVYTIISRRLHGNTN